MFDNEYKYDELDTEQPIARCACCEELIYEDNDDTYIDEDGNYFCSLDCVLEHYGVSKIEN